MQKINLWAFYVIGWEIRSLIMLRRADVLVAADAVIPMRRALSSVEALCNSDVKLSLATREAAKNLISQIEHCLEIWNLKTLSLQPQTDEGKADRDMAYRSFSNIKIQSQRFEILLANEFEGASTFVVPQKGTHQTALLLESAATNLSEAVRSRMPKDAIRDVNEAGKCLALDAPTAAGFHILRAIEALMRDYHFKLAGTHLKKQQRNWGRFIDLLDAHGADEKVTGFLRHIKDHYRNPIVHPEAILKPDEAFSLFNAGLSAITMLDGAINPE